MVTIAKKSVAVIVLITDVVTQRTTQMFYFFPLFIVAFCGGMYHFVLGKERGR